MAVDYILYNPLSCNGQGEQSAHRLDDLKTPNELVYKDITKINNMDNFISSLNKGSSITICGGDGTLNHFINHTNTDSILCDVFYFPCGTGNDFYHDVCENNAEMFIKINDYMKDLPSVKVKDKTYKFLNNVGFGIDGYCCQVGDKMREQHKQNINYTGIAIKGLMGGFKPVTAEVTVDGISEQFPRAWLAPTMNGRFYGGGMMPTPDQNRLRADKKVSVMLFYGHGKFKTLAVFPSIFQGEHIKHKDMVKIIEGNHVKVSFSRPCALQIDGETILDVSEYEVITRG